MFPIQLFGNGGIIDADWMIIFILIFVFLFMFIVGIRLKSVMWQILSGFFCVLLATQVYRITISTIASAAIASMGMFIIVYSMMYLLKEGVD